MGRAAQESDISVGYITNFLDGAVALQTNAAYQTNAQGQRGATGVFAAVARQDQILRRSFFSHRCSLSPRCAPWDWLFMPFGWSLRR